MSPQEQGGVAAVKINGVTRGGVRWVICPPLESLREILELKGKREARGEKEEDFKGKERQGKKEKWKMENGEEKKGNCKRGGGKLKMERGKWAKDLFFLSFFFFIYFFFLAFHFLKPPKFVWGVPKWIFFGGGMFNLPHLFTPLAKMELLGSFHS